MDAGLGPDAWRLALVGGAAVAGGAVNAIAGGGSLLTFPALLACGVPPVTASATNTVAMCPGYLGATWAQRRELAGQGRRALAIIPAAIAGGAGGALLLLRTGDRAFAVGVPFLLVFAVALLGFQDAIRARLHARTRSLGLAAASCGLAAVYGGYFGAGLGVILLAALAIVVGDTLVRLNALKQAISLAINTTAAAIFLAIAELDAVTVLVMAAGSLAGGVLGGAFASRVSARALRGLVLAIGLALAVVYFVKLFRHF